MTTEKPTAHIPRQRQPVEIFPLTMDSVPSPEEVFKNFRPYVIPADSLEVTFADEPEEEEGEAKQDPKDSSVPEPAASSEPTPPIEPTPPETPVPAPVAKVNTPPKAPSRGKPAS